MKAFRRAQRLSSVPWDLGSSLVELAVTVTLLSLVMTSAFLGFNAMQNAGNGANERTLNLSEAQLLMNAASKDLRTAARPDATTSPFGLAADREVTFQGNINTTGGPNQVHIYLNNRSELIEEVIPPTNPTAPWIYDPANVRLRVVGQYVVNPLATPVFVYLDAARVPLATGPANCPAVYSTPGTISCVNLATGGMSINAVGITFLVRHSTNLQVRPTMLVNQVFLPNLDYNPTGP